MEIHAMTNKHANEELLHNVPIPANHPKRLYLLHDSVQQVWEQAGVKYVGDGNNGCPLGLTDLEEAWVEGKRQFPSKFHDLPRVKVLPETPVRRITFGRMNGALVANFVGLVDGRHVLAP
jgi:hypothetical protein